MSTLPSGKELADALRGFADSVESGDIVIIDVGFALGDRPEYPDASEMIITSVRASKLPPVALEAANGGGV